MLRIHKHSKLVSTRCSSTGWIKYDEQYHLRKPHYPLSCWCYVYIEFWFLCVSTLEFEDTTGAIRIRKSEKNREHIGQRTEEQRTHWPKDRRTENTLAKRQKNREHIGQKKKDKRTNNDLQNIHCYSKR